MPDAEKTFSESWYRVAGQRLCLRPQVQMQRQHFRGRRWYVVRDPYSNQFFRLHPAAHAFVARLRRDRTVEEVWNECLALHPAEAPGQQEVINLLAQLFFANLLQCENPADSAALFERYRRRRGQEVRSRIVNIMFSRFPLLDPDRFLLRALPLVRPLIGPLGAVLWLAVVGWAVKVAVEHFPDLSRQGDAILSPANLPLLYLALVVIKALHEFGHAFVCRRFGGEVHEMGITLLIFTPLPYVDASSAWAFRSRWRRVVVGASGMMTELFFAAGATFVWAGTGTGTLHSLAYNIMFIASVSTVLFNANPLLRWDGYYILSDLLDIPNLHSQAAQQLRHLLDHYAFGVRDSRSPANTRREAFWLTVFGILSQVYRAVVFVGVIFFVAQRFLLAGIVMAVLCFVFWVLRAVGTAVHYLAANPRLERTRPRAIAVSVAFVAGVLFLLEALPYPVRFRAPGIVQAEEQAFVVNETAGFLQRPLAGSGIRVEAGQPLAELVSPDLDFETRLVHAQLEQAQALRRKALDEGASDLRPIDSHIAAVQAQVEQLERRRASLVPRAPHRGLWIAPNLEDFQQAWLGKGTALGQVINPETFFFLAVVSQRDAARLFAEPPRAVAVRLRGQAETALDIRQVMVIPAQQDRLPSAALGWLGGGEVAVDTQDSQGTRAAEPFFEVRLKLDADPGIPVFHGRSGQARFEFQPEPLLEQGWRRLRQTLQRRFRL